MIPIRTFIAVELPDALRAQLEHFIARLREDSPIPVKWVNPSGIHLTLKFLGNIAPNTVPAIAGAIEAAAQDIAPFRLHTGATGVFPNAQRAQVAWVGLEGDVECLAGLQRRLETNLSRLGFAPEARAFTPHLTLARLNRQTPPAARQGFGEMICKASFDPVTIEVDALSLIKSQLSRAGAIYTCLKSVRLGEKPG